MFNGKRQKKALKTKNYNQAVRLGMELNERIEDKKISPALAVNKDNNSFAHTAQKYTESRTIRPKTIERYNEIATNINKGFECITGKPETPLQEVTRQLVQDYIKYRQTTKISPNGHENTPLQEGIAPKSAIDKLPSFKC